MEHSMAIRADGDQVADVYALCLFKLRDRLTVMRLNKVSADITINFQKIEAAYPATVICEVPLEVSNEARGPFTLQVQAQDPAPFFIFVIKFRFIEKGDF